MRQDNPQAANRVVSSIRRDTQLLSNTPLLGRPGRMKTLGN
ncbi:MAG: type II toxin-antitoxin system RelE/ParE family toxin [Proteobacteria bacterium]|nr:type II toxin-antitoxin system RelE/ParE family toxin [Pseudomonadota bacterium]